MGKTLAVIREASAQARSYALLRTSQASGAEYPFQAVNADDTSPLKVGTMWRPLSKLILRICGDFKQSVKKIDVQVSVPTSGEWVAQHGQVIPMGLPVKLFSLFVK